MKNENEWNVNDYPPYISDELHTSFYTCKSSEKDSTDSDTYHLPFWIYKLV